MGARGLVEGSDPEGEVGDVVSQPALRVRFRPLGPLAQLAEQQTLNLRVLGSIPRRLTISRDRMRRGSSPAPRSPQPVPLSLRARRARLECPPPRAGLDVW